MSTVLNNPFEEAEEKWNAKVYAGTNSESINCNWWTETVVESVRGKRDGGDTELNYSVLFFLYIYND